MFTQVALTLLAQTEPPPPLPWAPIAGGGALLLVLLLTLVFGLRGRAKPPSPPPEPPRVTLPEPSPRPKVELPPNEAELARRQDAERAHREAEALRTERLARAEAAKAAEAAAERDRLEAEARALKEREEEAKRAEYRARKAAEQEERDRKKREQEEADRLQAEAEARQREEEAARARAAAEEERKRVEAEAGQTLAQGLAKTRNQGFIARLNAFLGGAPKQVDESVLAELEEVLFTADIGVHTASRLVELARDKAKRKELESADGLKSVIRAEVERIVDLPERPTLDGGGPPHVLMVVGVNGSGKTTTIGKLAAQSRAHGKKVVLAAGDTFRAAAAEQLDVWAERAGAELVKGKEDADPASVVFDGAKRAQEVGADLLIADTAGRLHTQTPLMEELKKVRRVLGKALPGAPHGVLLVLDATTGQNAIAQAKQFHEAVGVTALALTKLDGTAKGGVVIGICDELKLPVAWVGCGEKIQDLRPFSPKEFVAALFD